MANMGHFIHCKDGVAQGEPMALIAYGLGILPLIRGIQADHPLITQPWYADYAGSRGYFGNIHRHLEEIMLMGLSFGYFPDPTKNI